MSQGKEPVSEIPLRITLVAPPRGVLFCLQGRGREPVGQTLSKGEDLVFDLAVRADESGAQPRFLGPFTQGPPAQRFIYVCSGTMAGEAGSCWTRRAKVPLSGISHELLKDWRASAAARLEARIRGTAKDGGPACASVEILGGWCVSAAGP